MRARWIGLLLVAGLFGCKAGSNVKIEDKDWDLVALGERDHPLGNGGRPVTLRFDSKSRTAGGNAGCNRYNGPYQLEGEHVTFGPALSTKMACVDGMDLENAWLGAHQKITAWTATESTLVLAGASGPLARFEIHKGP